MTRISHIQLEQRLRLLGSQCISERFAKSPNMTEHYLLSEHIHISLAKQDLPALPVIRECFLKAYRYSKDWFAHRDSIEFDLWVAPEVVDLQYMVCLNCDETFFCAPGCREGMHVIVFVSPLSCRMNADKERLSGIFAHEITHHIVRNISNSSANTTQRKQDRSVPMWLEEGLCLFIDSEMYPPIQQCRAEKIAGITKWLDWEELWNDLSSCKDAQTAYLQAYRLVRYLMENEGKTKIIRLLHLNQTYQVNWNVLLFNKADRSGML